MTAPAEQPGRSDAVEAAWAALRGSTALSAGNVRAVLDAVWPVIAAQVRAEVAEQIAQEIEEAAAEGPSLWCAWTTQEAIDIARINAVPDEAEERTAVAESEQVWTGDQQPQRFRVGRKVGRTIYRQHGDEPGERDELIGMLDTRELAAFAVGAMNGAAGVRPEVAEERQQMLRLIGDLTDADDCWFDHHGGCQAHGYRGELCPHQEAKELLARHEGDDRD